MFENQSVGRLYFNLTKKSRMTRWKKLNASSQKLPNLIVWWEMHDKYEKDLDEIESVEDDDSSAFKGSSSTTAKKPKKKKNKKNKKKAAKQKEETSEEKQDL